MTLKKGSKGEEVKKLQEKLGLFPDGDFGPNTEKAVKVWQKANGLLDDGIVGDKTLKKMGITIQTITEDVVITPSSTLNLDGMKTHVPEKVLKEIADVMEKFKINNPLRIAHFLSQCAHESGNFRTVNENLNYSASGLMSTFTRHFPNKALAEQYARNPEKIASKVYGSRMGNGNESTKEGWKFRGRGYIQLTGKDNYRAFNNFVDEDILENPDLVSTKYPLLSAAWFFNKNCLSKSDLGTTDEAISAVTRCVNGGYNGIEDRKKHFKKYYKILSGG